MPTSVSLNVALVCLLGISLPAASAKDTPESGAAPAPTSSTEGLSPSDPLAAWQEGHVHIRPVGAPGERHTIHAYFNTCPESPDGTKVIFFSSTARDGQFGDVCVVDRATGEEKVLAKGIHCEDAHRVACQQWVSHGQRVVYHDERQGQWLVACVDLADGKERILARDHLCSWGRPDADLVPVYGPHWNPGSNRDLQLVNVVTGEITTPLKVDAIREAFPDYWAKTFGDKQPSIFFPILSPDLKRVFFKMAVAAGGDPRSKEASDRQGLICYSLAEKRFLYMNARWGHPSWESDSRTIVEAGNLLYDSNDGARTAIPHLPGFRGDHPSASPDRKLLVTDTTLDRFGRSAGDWGVVVYDPQGSRYTMIHRFDNSHGASSWRRSHPHPVFSADGRRIYFNVSSGPWTQLYVAETDWKPQS